MFKRLPSSLTSYDFFKIFALLTMFIDHIGYFYFPEDLTLRAIGRLCVPVWLFLIGYARSRDTSGRMFFWAFAMMAAGLWLGKPIMPLNMVLTIIIVRLSLNPLMRVAARGEWALWGIVAVLGGLALLSTAYFEYGTIAIILAISGYYARQRDDGLVDADRVWQVLCVSMVLFVASEQPIFHFHTFDFTVLCVGLGAVMIALAHFQPEEYPALTASLPGPLVTLIQFCGRRTLEIYVVHFVILIFLASDYFPILLTWLRTPTL